MELSFILGSFMIPRGLLIVWLVLLYVDYRIIRNVVDHEF